MTITKDRLNGEDVRQTVEAMVTHYIPLGIKGYKCDTAGVVNVLVKAAIEGQTVESTCSDLQLEVTSNTVRAQLNQTLDACALREHESHFNAGLAASLPTDLPQRGLEMVIDCHDEPFYGKTALLQHYTCRGQTKEGTSHFTRVASLYVIWRQVRLTLALTYVLPEHGNLSIVQRLLQRMLHLGFRPSVVYLDKGFCEGAILQYLTKAHIPAIIACPIRGTSAGTRALCRGRQSYLTDYVFRGGIATKLAVVPSRTRKAQFTHRRTRKWLVYVVIHLDWSALKVARRYRRRFGVESGYRQVGSLRARTTSRNPALRFFLLALSLLLRNIWLLLRWLSTRELGPGLPRWRPNAFRLPRFIAFLRRAIEHRYVTTDAISIYSC
jgi:hypothetical protein